MRENLFWSQQGGQFPGKELGRRPEQPKKDAEPAGGRGRGGRGQAEGVRWG